MNSDFNEPKLVKISYESRILRENALQDAAARDLFVLLPADYDASWRKYPVVYVLHAFGGNNRGFLNDNVFAPNLPQRIARLVSQNAVKPMIYVLPDCFTFYGGSQFINSTATGNYENYLCEEIVPFIDENFRTIRHADARALIGKSSGGYGALRLAMKHAELFGLCASLSGDCYFEMCYLPDFPKAFRTLSKVSVKDFMHKFWNDENKGANDFSALNIIGMSAAYSPNDAAENGFDLPFDLQTGAIREEIWQKWLQHDPLRMAETYAENLKSLKLLYIEAGTRDEFFLDVGARVLSRKLSDLGITHRHEEFDGGHFGVSYRFNNAFEIISKNIESDSAN